MTYDVSFTTASHIILTMNEDGIVNFFPLSRFPCIIAPFDLEIDSLFPGGGTFHNSELDIELNIEFDWSDLVYECFNAKKTFKMGDVLGSPKSTRELISVAGRTISTREPLDMEAVFGFPPLKRENNRCVLSEKNIIKTRSRIPELADKIPVYWSYVYIEISDTKPDWNKYQEARVVSYVNKGEIATPPTLVETACDIVGWTDSDTLEFYDNSPITHEKSFCASYPLVEDCLVAKYNYNNQFEKNVVSLPFYPDSQTFGRYGFLPPKYTYPNEFDKYYLYENQYRAIGRNIVSPWSEFVKEKEVPTYRWLSLNNPLPLLTDDFSMHGKEVVLFFYEGKNYIKIFEPGEQTTPIFESKDGYEVSWEIQKIVDGSYYANIPVKHEAIGGRGLAYMGFRGKPIEVDLDLPTIISILYTIANKGSGGVCDSLYGLKIQR